MLNVSDDLFELAVEKFIKMSKTYNLNYKDCILGYGNVIKRQSYNNLERIKIFEKLIYPEMIKFK